MLDLSITSIVTWQKFGAQSSSIASRNSRKKALIGFLATHKKNNPDINIDDVKHDMKLLIKEKIRMFPDIETGIVNARIKETENEYRIVAVSTKQVP